MEITTLIPAYRSDYLREVFEGLAQQTYKNFKIIISDDSPNQEISTMIKDGMFSDYTRTLHITLIKGPGHEGENHNRLIRFWGANTHLAHIHHDDDYILSDFYENHVKAHSKLDILLSSSGRWFLASNRLIEDPYKPKIFNEGSTSDFILLNSRELIKSLVTNTRNWIGEVSNMVISAKAWKFHPYIPDPLDPYYGLTDISLAIKCAANGKVAYTKSKHGVYRIHEQQGTVISRGRSWLVARMCWISFAVQAWRDGHISHDDCIKGIKSAIKFCDREFKDDLMWTYFIAELREYVERPDEFSNIFENKWMKVKNPSFDLNKLLDVYQRTPEIAISFKG